MTPKHILGGIAILLAAVSYLPGCSAILGVAVILIGVATLI